MRQRVFTRLLPRPACGSRDRGKKQKYPCQSWRIALKEAHTAWARREAESGLVLKGYSSVGRAAVSKTAGRGFEPLCPCHVLTRKRATSLHGGWGAGYPANSPNVDFLLLKWESAFM